MRWTFDQLYYTPPVYFFMALEGFLTHEERKKKELYEIIRVHATAILNSFSKRQIRPENIMKFRWDQKSEDTMTDTQKEKQRKILRYWIDHPPTRAGESPTARIKN